MLIVANVSVGHAFAVLLSAGLFGALAATTVTNTGPTYVKGKVAVSPGAVL